MSKGSDEQTTRTEPWAGAQPFMWASNSLANSAVNNQLPMYGGPTFAPYNPLQIGAQHSTLDYAQNRFQPGVGFLQQSLSDQMTSPNRVTQNPAVQALMGSNRGEVTDALTRDWLPQIRSGAALAGQYGGSRQGIGEGIAVGDAAKALARSNAQILGGAYSDALQSQRTASTLMPGALSLGFQGPEVAMQIGQMQQDQYNRAIQEQMQRYYYPEQKMWDTLSKAQAIYANQPFSNTSTTAPGSSPIAGAIGGASAGAGIASALSLSGPWGWGLAGLGGLLGALG